MRTGRQDSPSISIPGFVPDPNRKTKFGYKECDSEAVNASPSHSDLSKAYTSLSGNSNSATSNSAKLRGLLFAAVTMTMQLFNRLWMNWNKTKQRLFYRTYLLQLWNRLNVSFLKWKKLQKTLHYFDFDVFLGLERRKLKCDVFFDVLLFDVLKRPQIDLSIFSNLALKMCAPRHTQIYTSGNVEIIINIYLFITINNDSHNYKILKCHKYFTVRTTTIN